jgi:two-component system CheB/CheR fusion protein
LWNVIHNAIKFTPRGGRVDMSTTHTDSEVVIVVSDTGQGISGEFLPYVFDRFRQADPSTTRGASGLGIGLSIVKHLVELHGGSIDASSPGSDRGATFSIRLPRVTASRGTPPQAAAAPDDPISGSVASSSTGRGDNLSL